MHIWTCGVCTAAPSSLEFWANVLKNESFVIPLLQWLWQEGKDLWENGCFAGVKKFNVERSQANLKEDGFVPLIAIHNNHHVLFILTII